MATDPDHPRRRFTQVSQCESDGARLGRSALIGAAVSTQNSSSSALSATDSPLRTECCPALLVSGAFSKPVHIASPSVLVDSDSLCVSSEEEIGIGHLRHYCVSTCTDGQLQDNQSAPSSSQVDRACAASSASVVHEVCTQATGDDDAGSRNGNCMNVVTLCSVWRLAAADIDDTDSTDSSDLFMIPIEESTIGQQNSLHELVID